MIEGRNSSYALLGGSIGAGAVFGNIAGAAIGAGVGSFVFGQWADAYASAAEKLYKFRNSTSKYFSWIEAVSGVFHLSHEFTKWAK